MKIEHQTSSSEFPQARCLILDAGVASTCIIVMPVKSTVLVTPDRSLSEVEGNIAKGNMRWLRLRSATVNFGSAQPPFLLILRSNIEDQGSSSEDYIHTARQ